MINVRFSDCHTVSMTRNSGTTNGVSTEVPEGFSEEVPTGAAAEISDKNILLNDTNNNTVVEEETLPAIANVKKGNPMDFNHAGASIVTFKDGKIVDLLR